MSDTDVNEYQAWRDARIAAADDADAGAIVRDHIDNTAVVAAAKTVAQPADPAPVDEPVNGGIIPDAPSADDDTVPNAVA